METITTIFSVFSLIILIFSVIIHELSHGSVAYSLGDPTAKYAGRLTLNPIKHLDMFGSIILPLLLFISGSPVLVGWAKPVPVNPYNFRDQKWGSLKVSIAGPLSNIALAIVFGLLIRFIPNEIFLSDPRFLIMHSLIIRIVEVNLILAIFNLVPIPPLDGSWILFSFLPYGFERVKLFLQQYGIILLILFIFFGGLQILNIITRFLYYIIIGNS